MLRLAAEGGPQNRSVPGQGIASNAKQHLHKSQLSYTTEAASLGEAQQENKYQVSLTHSITHQNRQPCLVHALQACKPGKL